jgi:hypothetical protein
LYDRRFANLGIRSFNGMAQESEALATRVSAADEAGSLLTGVVPPHANGSRPSASVAQTEQPEQPESGSDTAVPCATDPTTLRADISKSAGVADEVTKDSEKVVSSTGARPLAGSPAATDRSRLGESTGSSGSGQIESSSAPRKAAFGGTVCKHVQKGAQAAALKAKVAKLKAPYSCDECDKARVVRAKGGKKGGGKAGGKGKGQWFVCTLSVQWRLNWCSYRVQFHQGATWSKYTERV